MDKVIRLASANDVVIFSKSSCCLCYAVNILFQEIGVRASVNEIDNDPDGRWQGNGEVSNEEQKSTPSSLDTSPFPCHQGHCRSH
ncbi:hypothetical protein ACLB2K_019545 [Fragaria x ananassa]